MFQLFNKRELIYAGVLLAGLSSCGHSDPAIKGGNSAPIRVKVISVSSSHNAGTDSYSGTVEAGSSTTPSFSVAGTITQINVSEGQRISKGQLIASVDGSSLKNTYEIAQATLREAQDAYARMKKLHDADALPDMQWVSVQEKLRQAEAAANIARTGMNDANLYAPMSGVVAHRLADVGQGVAPGVPIIEIMDVGTLKVKISVPESDLNSMTAGMPATVTVGGRSYSASLVEKGVAANALSRNYDIKFRITNPDETLLPGMICNVTVDGVTPSTTDTATISEIVLPPQAVVLDWDNTSYVWIMKDGLAQRKKIEVGGLDSRGIIVRGGISLADTVIVEGQQKLSLGLKVVPVK
ncbi:MAG: efflux RND transporter periplasmic adaptor subunit [Muribaculaceae bacterium]|nr:efflux RND transporter periplasmic adaptor subunit [Muribaculaceae bacterium]